ncbi:MAG: PilT/PilU family type 4a pilus ATPase [Verrucomicrobiota bacterium JB022]|nr:PilT/PilU family type 4a pilus ATPase [Verrucomicrobiota bacterium JB022]
MSVAAGDNADIVTFAELLLEYTITDDFDLVQEILDEAAKQDWSKLPPSNPFDAPPAFAKPTLPSRARQLPDYPTAEAPPAPPEPPVFAPEPEQAPAPEPEPAKPRISLRSEAKPKGGDSFLDEIAGLVEQINSAPPSGPRATGGSGAGGGGTYGNAPGGGGPGAHSGGTSAPSPEAAESPAAPKGPRPAEYLVPTAGVQAAWPRFDQLERVPPDQLGKHFVGLLIAATRDGASDVHLCAEARPFVREQGKIRYLADKPVSARLVANLIRSGLSPAQWQHFQSAHDFDFALALDNGMRFRTNLMVHKDGYQGVFRTVQARIPTLEELGFQDAERIRKLLSYHNGLILVTGPLGSGKTTTLAAMVRELNERRQDHLITLEEPIENVFPSRQCQITQRSVGPHTESFKRALKGALRQDPDIIVIGEMRDLETIEMAISASETGHLVIGTMHTSDSATTLNRLLDVFPPAQQSQIRAMVAESLRGIVCQRLLPAKSGGVALASELLLRNMAVSVLIREGKTQNLANVMETGKREGMRLMDASILQLWREGRIADEVALANIRNRMLAREIQGGGAPAASGSEDDFGSLSSLNQENAPKKRGLFR